MGDKTTDPSMTLKVLWMAFLATIVIFTVVLHVIPIQPAEVGSNLEMILSVVAGVLLLSSFMLRSVLLGRKEITAEQRIVFHIVPYAMNEAAAIMGFLLGFLSGDPSAGYPLLAAAFVLTLIMRPKR